MELHGNLVWPDNAHPYPQGKVDDGNAEAGSRGICCHGSDENRYASRLKAFDGLVAKKMPGLDEQIASLLLHVVAPEDFVPLRATAGEKCSQNPVAARLPDLRFQFSGVLQVGK